MDLSFAPSITRGHVRLAVSTPCQVVAENGFRLLGEQTLDLSPAGLLVKSSAPVMIGEAVILTLRSPFGQQWIDAEGFVERVLWKAGGRFAVGVSFTSMSALDEALLAGGLSVLRATPRPAVGHRCRRDYASAVLAIAA